MMDINVIIAILFGGVALWALVALLRRRNVEFTGTEEKVLHKENNQRRWFLTIFFGTLSLVMFFWGFTASGMNGWGWLIAIIAFTVAAFIYAKDRFKMASVVASAAAVVILAAPIVSAWGNTPLQQDTTALIRVIDKVAPTDSAAPALLTGAATVTEEAPATVQCGLQDDGSSIALPSWAGLVDCITDAPESERATYIAAADDRSDIGLSWNDIQKYAEREQAEGIDSRSILAINVGNITDEEIRAGAAEAAGEAAATLPIVRQDGYLLNSGNFHTATAASGIGNFADGRSQIRVQLNPIDAPDVQTVAASHQVKLSSFEVNYDAKGGVLVECANFSGKVTPEPPAPPVQPPVPPVTPPTTPPTVPPTIPPTVPPTTPPCVPGPVKCEEDDRLEEDPVNPAPEPSGDPEVEEPVEEDPAGPPSEEPPGSEAPEVPAPGVDPGTGEDPRVEVPEVPDDVPANENETPLEGDQDPDSGSSDMQVGQLPEPPVFEPVPEAPVEEAPAPPAPVEEAPAPEAPAEEAPAVETPAEDAPPAIDDSASLGMLIPAGIPLLALKLRGRRLFK